MKKFSFIELIVVLVIISSVIAVISPSIINMIEESRRTRVEVDMSDIAHAVKLYYTPSSDIYKVISGDDILEGGIIIPKRSEETHASPWDAISDPRYTYSGVNIESRSNKDIFSKLIHSKSLNMDSGEVLADPWGTEYSLKVRTATKGFNKSSSSIGLLSIHSAYVTYSVNNEYVKHVVPFIGTTCDVTIFSAGPDREFGNFDDITKEIKFLINQ